MAMLVFFHRLSVWLISGGTVTRSDCGRMTRRMVLRKPKPRVRPASICSLGMERKPLRMSSDI
ncbi:hypothetical protein D3C84_1172940 [compost metagenome]